ncbi:MAG: hypothetical protein P4L79_02895 [Legionella sp.]|uniref:hypothetical protein n=1 Tax=Legionella sp. TaxID=459 RepID=UPI00285163FB|nr:hypothetical protein [Legionella sp.]
MYSKGNGFFPPPLTNFFIDNTVEKPDFEQNLPSTVYQPFLEDLFKLLAAEFPQHQFILTGSAAKQLQDPTKPNPNDLDFLMGNEDLVQGISQIKAVLKKMAVQFTFDDLRGTLVVVHDGHAIKIQLIDAHTSYHCYPPKDQLNDLRANGSIRMLAAGVIPEVDLSDDIIITDLDGNELMVNEIEFSDCSMK